jgi:ribosomal protein S27AE
MTGRSAAWDGPELDNILIYLVIGLALGACIITPLMMLALMKHQDRVQLDHYGKYRGGGPAKSFVCPDCLTRSYAASHVARRWCGKCEKSFPEKEQAEPSDKAWRSEAQAAE